MFTGGLFIEIFQENPVREGGEEVKVLGVGSTSVLESQECR